MSTFQALALILGAAISTVYVLIRIQGATRSLAAGMYAIPRRAAAAPFLFAAPSRREDAD